jgi:hypothetical protein
MKKVILERIYSLPILYVCSHLNQITGSAKIGWSQTMDFIENVFEWCITFRCLGNVKTIINPAPDEKTELIISALY